MVDEERLIEEVVENFLFSDDDELYDLLLETTSSSDSMSDEPEERQEAVRIPNYMAIIDEYSDNEFVKHFRLTRNASHHLIERVEDANILSTVKSGHAKVTSKEAVYIVLWYLSNTETFRQMADRFNRTESTIYNIIRTMTNYLVTVSSDYIKWPTDKKAIKEIINGFKKKQNLNGVLGAIDGTHIKIRKPKVDQQAYCNRKGFHSILLQGVVDHKKRFIDVFCGEAGSIHDARLLKKSRLFEKIVNHEIRLGDNYLIGDAAYPNLSWLVTPFKNNGHLTVTQDAFNFKLSSTRMIIENAFGLLKGRFRRLRYFDNVSIDLVVRCAVAATVLHNICINDQESNEVVETDEEMNENHEEMDEDDEEMNEEEMDEEEDNHDDVFPEDCRRRDALFNRMFN